MNISRRYLTVAVLTSSLALLSLIAPHSVAADKKDVISKSELKALLTTASTPADHQKIADYYHNEAENLTDSAKEHQDLAALYDNNAAFRATQMKHGDMTGLGASHCRKLSELQAEAAKESEALAVLHENMAKATANK